MRINQPLRFFLVEYTGLRFLFVQMWVGVFVLLQTACGVAEEKPDRAILAGSAGRAGTTPSALGMNLSSVNDWNREWVFVDVFKQSRNWISQNVGGTGEWDNQRPIATDEAGWPQLRTGQAATTLLCRDLEGHYPSGLYTATYEGSGEISWGFDARPRVLAPGRITLDVAPSNAGILLRIERSDPRDPVRNLRVWMPGFENAANPFHPLFLERLKPFKVVRFMDWANTNNSQTKSWSERTTPNDARQSGDGGVSLEYMIELCNRLEADPWFCMPHLADDDYVRQFAKLVHSRLRPDAHVYVEWSNEAWNNLFDQAAWVQGQAKQRGCRWTWVIADEARRDWTIWREVFREQPDRIIRVAAGQHYNPWVCQDIADRLNGQFDALACGAYFFPQPMDEARFSATTKPETVLASCLANIESTGSANWKQHDTLADSWSRRLNRPIALLAYEGGQHLTTAGKDLPLTNAYAQAQTHPDMRQVYEQLFASLRRNNFKLFMAFNYVGRQDTYGSWGHLRYQTESLDDSPKFRALYDAVRSVPSESKD
jgi:hypothetical protein